MLDNSEILNSIMLEWLNGLDDGEAANKWWQNLHHHQKLLVSDSAISFFRKKLFEENQGSSEKLIRELIHNTETIGCLNIKEEKKSDRLILSGKINLPYVGIRGKCYSQPPDFVGKVIKETLGIYTNKSRSHDYGEKTVDIVCFALNALPGVTASQTPWNSVADVGLRWDLIINWQEYIFPIQIKSSPKGMLNALEEEYLGNYAIEQMEMYENLIENLSNYENRNDIKYQIEILEEREKIYRWSMPLYIWTAHTNQAISYLVELFANTFNIQTNLDICIEQGVEAYKDKNPKIGSMQRDSLAEQRRIKRINERRIYKKRVEIAEKIIQYLQNQVESKKKRIRNRKQRKRPEIPEHLQSLNIVENALILITNFLQKKEFDNTIFLKYIQELVFLDELTDSPCLEETKKLFELTKDFTQT